MGRAKILGGGSGYGGEIITTTFTGKLFSHYTSGSKTIQERDPDTYLIISDNTSIGFSLYGFGGTGSRLFGNKETMGDVVEIDVDTRLVIATKTRTWSTSYNSQGIGGFGNRLFVTAYDSSERLYTYEIDPDTMAIINSIYYGSTAHRATGIDGMANGRLFAAWGAQDYKIREIDPDTLNVIATSSSGFGSDADVAGTVSRMYSCYRNGIYTGSPFVIREFDPDTFVISNTYSMGAYYENIAGVTNVLNYYQLTLDDIPGIPEFTEIVYKSENYEKQ